MFWRGNSPLWAFEILIPDILFSGSKLSLPFHIEFVLKLSDDAQGSWEAVGKGLMSFLLTDFFMRFFLFMGVGSTN